MLVKQLSSVLIAAALVTCQSASSQTSHLPASTPDVAKVRCPHDDLDAYLTNYEQIMSDFLDASQVATFSAEKRAEAAIVMLSYISDLKIADAPECAQAHKDRAIAAMQSLVDATFELGTTSEITEIEAAILEPALREIEHVNDEAAELDSLLK